MRFSRLIAFATWVVVALLSVASFAGFSPGGQDDPATPGVPIDAGAGEAAGRQAAFGLARQTSPTSTPTTIETMPPSSTPDPTTATSTTTRPPVTTTVATGTSGDSGAGDTSSRSNAPVLSSAGMWNLMAAHFAPGDVERAVAVAWCESHFDAGAYNARSGASGLFQHLPKYWDARAALAGYEGADIFDPDANAAVAAWLVYSHGGWKHWAPSQKCWAATPVATTTTTTVVETTTTTTAAGAAPTTTVPATTTVPTTTLPATTTTTTLPATTTTTTLPATTTTTTLPATTTTTTVPATTTTTTGPAG